MKNFVTAIMLVAAVAMAPSALATWYPSSDRCNGVNNCNDTDVRNYNTTNNTHNETHNTTNNVDNSRNLTNTATGGQGGRGGDGTGVGVGLGFGQGGDARATGGSSRVGDTTARVGDTSARATGGDVSRSGNSSNLNLVDGAESSSRSGVYGSGNSASLSGARATGGDVSRSGNSDVENTVRNNNDLSNRNANLQGQGQGQMQGQVGINVQEGDTNRNRAVNGDVSGSNTLIIGGQGGEFQGEGEGSSTLSPTADSLSRSRVGDTTATTGDQNTTVDGNNSSNTIGDINVTVEGLSEEAARNLPSDSVTTEVDARDLSTENQNIDASTTINDNSVYEAPKMSAASAAPSFASICTSGMSGQSRSYGLSLSVTSDVCQNLMMADAWMALGDREKAIDFVKRAGSHAKTKSTVGYIRNIITLGIL